LGCRRDMAVRSAISPATCIGMFIFLLFCCVFRLMQCRHVSVDGLVGGTGLPDQAQKGLRMELVRTDTLLGNITSTERLKRAVERSKKRLETLQLSAVLNTNATLVDEMQVIEAPVNAGKGVNAENGEFVMNMAIGTPPSSFSAILDSGSDLIWTQCKPCRHCYNQTIPMYDPSLSSTYRRVPCKNPLCYRSGFSFCKNNSRCVYGYYYADADYTRGTLSYETFTLSSQSAPHIAFGCGHRNKGRGFSQGSGLVGFGRGPLSLMSQLGPLVGNKFSYCLVSVNDSLSKSSPLFIGNTTNLNGTNVSSTPIILSVLNPSFYYISLEGISVDGKLLEIPVGTFDLHSNGTGGVIIDSGTTFTHLLRTGYDILKKALISSINLPLVEGGVGGMDLCFNLQRGSANPKIPTVTFHFKGANYHLSKENYILAVSSDVLCLAMLPSSGISIFGNVQQQNYHILYDNENNMLSFSPAVCDAL